MSTELVQIKPETAMTVFTAPLGLDPYLAKIREEIDAFMPDVSTKKGRDAIASIAHKVAKSKTYLDGVGKELVDRLKEQPKLVDAERKRMRELLDGWKEEVRQPLTEWESAEEARVAGLRSRLERFQILTIDRHLLSTDELRHCIREAEAAVIDASWQEYAAEAAIARDGCLRQLNEALSTRIKADDEQAELARLRAEAAESDRIAAEEKSKAEQAERERVAAENARIAAEQKAAQEKADAEAKAKAEIDAAERREREAREAAERAEQQRIAAEKKAEEDRIAAEQRAEREKHEAIENERRRAEAEQKRIAEEAERREANKRHAAKINNAAAAALVDGGIDADTARTVVTLIAQRKVPNVSIQY